jgi:phosphoglucomutase
MDIKEKYNAWLEEPFFDTAFKEELRTLSEAEIEDRFYQDLRFGTGGLRGILGAGSNRINIYVVQKVTQGYANYLNKRYQNPSIAIAYDSRRQSDEFARKSAEVLAGNGIKVYLFKEVASTPELSYAVREMGCSGGIVITASHNPAQYNGYKVYHHEGYQLLPEDAALIVEEVDRLSFSDIQCAFKESDLIQYLGEDFFERYYAEILKATKKENKELSIVYTPLNGAGARPVTEVLKRAGFKNFHGVEEQMVHDSNFTTVPYPNPEEAAVFEHAIVLGKRYDADILMATDPDADRVGVFVKHDGEYIGLNGNQIGALLGHALLQSNQTDQMVVTTIVSSHLIDRIADANHALVKRTLTGFKYIGELMTRYEDSGYRFVLGFEESYGYLTGMHARDKDAVNAALAIADLAEHLKKNGMTLYDQLHEIYEKYGYFKEDLINYAFEGRQGQADMDAVINRFRTLDSFKCCEVESTVKIDYLTDETGLEVSNVLKFIYPDDSWFAVRPSGTEPKLKIYVSVNANTEVDSLVRLSVFKNTLENFVGTQND